MLNAIKKAGNSKLLEAEAKMQQRALEKLKRLQDDGVKPISPDSNEVDKAFEEAHKRDDQSSVYG